MIDTDLKTIAQTLNAALARRVDLSDVDDLGALIDQHLQARVLQNYRDQLDGLEGADAMAWLLHRMAEIEARLLAVQLATARPDGASLPAAADFALPRSAVVPFDENLAEAGFYPAEEAPDGRMFRWLGPAPQASVFLPKLQLPVEICIKVHSAFVRHAIDQVRVALDGGEWVGVQVRHHEGGFDLTARPLAGPITHAGTMRLDIDAVVSESPAAKGENDDRSLSIAIAGIDVASL